MAPAHISMDSSDENTSHVWSFACFDDVGYQDNRVLIGSCCEKTSLVGSLSCADDAGRLDSRVNSHQSGDACEIPTDEVVPSPTHGAHITNSVISRSDLQCADFMCISPSFDVAA